MLNSSNTSESTVLLLNKSHNQMSNETNLPACGYYANDSLYGSLNNSHLIELMDTSIDLPSSNPVGIVSSVPSPLLINFPINWSVGT